MGSGMMNEAWGKVRRVACTRDQECGVVWRWCKSLYEANHEWRAEHEPMAEVESEGAILGAGDPKLKPLIIGEPGTD